MIKIKRVHCISQARFFARELCLPAGSTLRLCKLNMKKNILSMIVCLSMIFPILGSAEEAVAANFPAAKYTYFTLKPDITTNFYTEGGSLGFIDVQVDIMVDKPELLTMVEKNQPLIRNAIIEVLNQEGGSQIKSLTGREAIRKLCLEKVNEALLAETGETVVADLLFTKYLYQ